MKIVFENVSFRYEDKEVLNNLNFTVDENILLSFLGASGSGKSTTLMLLSGLLKPDSGKIYFNDVDVTNLDPVDRNIGMVFQNYALYPHMTVRKNISFPLEMTGVPKKDREAKINELAELVHIDDLLESKPGELSGGQQQRVAIARALAKDPEILLMDEPLSNLDAKLRIKLRDEIRTLQKKTGVTTVFVTHDQNEALSISDEVMLLDQGKIQHQASPTDIYSKPKNLFTATFLGTPEINVFTKEDLALELNASLRETVAEKGIKYIGIRSEDFYRVFEPEKALVQGTVKYINIVGKEVTVKVETESGYEIVITDIKIDFAVDEHIYLAADDRKLNLFDANRNRVE